MSDPALRSRFSSDHEEVEKNIIFLRKLLTIILVDLIQLPRATGKLQIRATLQTKHLLLSPSVEKYRGEQSRTNIVPHSDNDPGSTGCDSPPQDYLSVQYGARYRER